MKKIISFLLVVVTFSACTNNPNKKIEHAFKDYVDMNFDNPKSLEEIVAIGNPKHYCIDSLFNDAHKYISLYDETKSQIDSIDSIIFAELNRIIEKDYKALRYIQTHKQDKYVRALLDNSNEYLSHKLEIAVSNKLSAYEKVIKIINDSSQNYNSYTTQTVKYRIHKNEKLHLDSVFYITKNDTINYISKNDITCSDLGGNCEELADILSDSLLEELDILIYYLDLLTKAETALGIIKSRI